MTKFPPFTVFLKGLATSIPGAYKILNKGTGGTISARYCYAVWMRHLVLTQNSSQNPLPKILGELGPGDSIGIGLSGLLSGIEKYFALDAVKHVNLSRNLQIFEELVVMFRNKEKIPDNKEFPDIVPLLDNYEFPKHLLTDEILDISLATARLNRIKKSIADSNSVDSMIVYVAPWDDQDVIAPDTADLIVSQFVLEHVNDLEKTYNAMFSRLKPGGVVSNVIDFQCHGTSTEWNGHWQYSKAMWGLIVGGRPFLLNREPAQTHINLLKANKFKILKIEKFYKDSKIHSESLADEYQNISYEDLKTLKIYIQAIK